MPDTLDTSQLPKLTIETYPDQKFDGSPDATYTVLFNPSEYTLTRTNNYNRSQAAGTSRPATSSSSGNPDSLSLTLFFDGSGVAGDAGPVTQRVNDFLKLMKYRGDKHKPRYLWVRWGWLTFRCVLKTATASFTLFDRDGEPIRARVNASFEEVIQDHERVNEEAASSPDLHRMWRVEEGQTIDAIAYEAYDDPAYWRELARANGLDNPRALVAGSVLHLPPKER
jgi:Contractile injection system tube protein/LysM domain